MTTQRLDSFDILKGIGILLVIIAHSYKSIGNTTLYELYMVIYSFHIPLFLLVSGYFFKQIPIKKAIKKNFRRLVVPYIFTAILIIIIATVLNRSFLDTTVPWTLAFLHGSYLTLSAYPFFADTPPLTIGPLWFLVSLFWGLLIYTIIPKKNKIITLLCVLLVSIAGYIAMKYFINAPWGIRQGMSIVIYLYIGNMVKEYNLLQKRNIWLTLSALLIWIGCFFLIGMKINIARGRIDPYYIAIPASVCAVYVIYNIARCIEEKTVYLQKTLTYIGKSSLTVLCFHGIDELLFYSFYHHLMIDTVSYITALCLRIAFPILCVLIIQRIPFIYRIFNPK